MCSRCGRCRRWQWIFLLRWFIFKVFRCQNSGLGFKGRCRWFGGGFCWCGGFWDRNRWVWWFFFTFRLRASWGSRRHGFSVVWHKGGCFCGHQRCQWRWRVSWRWGEWSWVYCCFYGQMSVFRFFYQSSRDSLSERSRQEWRWRNIYKLQVDWWTCWGCYKSRRWSVWCRLRGRFARTSRSRRLNCACGTFGRRRELWREECWRWVRGTWWEALKYYGWIFVCVYIFDGLFENYFLVLIR